MPTGPPQPPAPCSLLPLDEDIVVDLPNVLVQCFSRPKVGRIEWLALLPCEVLLGRPVIRRECIHVRTPLEVMTQLVGECFPGFLAPVEVAQPGKAREIGRASCRERV